MLKRWCSIKEIEVYLLCEILTLKDTLQGKKKTVASLLKLWEGLEKRKMFLGDLVDMRQIGVVSKNKGEDLFRVSSLRTRIFSSLGKFFVFNVYA